jgi:TonB family protein
MDRKVLVTKRTGIHLALLVSLAGCVQPLTVPDSLRLEEDEGLIVYRMKCGPGVAWGRVYRSGENPKGYKAESPRSTMLSCADDMQVQSLRAGRYFIGKVGALGAVDFSEEAAMQFDVAAGKLSYIGHITLPSSVDDESASLRMVLITDPFVSDRREDAIAWLAANQASLQGRYEFIVGLAGAPGKPAANGLAEQGGQRGAAEFTVVLKLRVGADGSVREGHIATSSGNPSLDETALTEAFRNWRVAPATESGKPVEKWGNYSVTYRLAI